MKNKIYILCLAADGKLIIFNVLKCDKIFEIKFQENYLTNFNKMIEILSQYDTETLKSWFAIDIKLGTITITFNKNTCFSNSFNFDQDYLEKIIEKTDNLKNIISAKNFNFYFPQDGLSPTNSSTNNTNNKNAISTKNSLQNDNSLSSTFNKRNSGMSSVKINNLGQSFIKSLFDTFVNDNLLEIKEFLQKNFYDKKNLLQKNFYEALKSRCSFDSEVKIYINQDIYLFSCEEEFVKCFAYFKEFKNYIKTIDFIKEHSPVDNVKII